MSSRETNGSRITITSAARRRTRTGLVPEEDLGHSPLPVDLATHVLEQIDADHLAVEQPRREDRHGLEGLVDRRRCSAWMSFHLRKYGSVTSSGMIRFTTTASTR